MSIDVARIEIDEIADDSEDEPSPRYFRDIRIRTTGGEILELMLSTEDRSALSLRKKPLMNDALEKDRGDPAVDWLTPKIDTGAGDEDA